MYTIPLFFLVSLHVCVLFRCVWEMSIKIWQWVVRSIWSSTDISENIFVLFKTSKITIGCVLSHMPPPLLLLHIAVLATCTCTHHLALVFFLLGFAWQYFECIVSPCFWKDWSQKGHLHHHGHATMPLSDMVDQTRPCLPHKNTPRLFTLLVQCWWLGAILSSALPLILLLFLMCFLVIINSEAASIIKHLQAPLSWAIFHHSSHRSHQLKSLASTSYHLLFWLPTDLLPLTGLHTRKPRVLHSFNVAKPP